MNTKYVAFLRGINVGGKMVKMEALRKAIEELGYEHVKTLLNSGNVVFEAEEKNEKKLQQVIEEKLEKVFGFHIDVLLRTQKNIQALVSADPFKGIAVTPQTRLYVTFLSEKSVHALKIPYESPEKDFRILRVTDTEVVSVLTLSEKRGTTDVMKIPEKEFGKLITTRNWNTVKKIAEV